MGLRAMRWALLCLAVGLTGFPANAADLDLNAYKGKVVYLDFWASWCTPCRQSFPWMGQIQESNGRRGLVVIAVNVDHDKDLAEKFLQRFSPRFKIVYDPHGEIAHQYGLKDMPTSYVIGRDGKVRFTHAGFYPNQQAVYSAHIEEVLNEPSR
ncbi:TlpA disulfide reductase family protein [Rhizomicrobium electricum]|uniref:TlpA disulfide reductase family protein n=1 Tax=Rhizomicrobium electricum TaxID=480070 RepID=A0ABP3QCU6_9PROT|nr:TlpA disulfide reductase family protein [Rhizomicrobium electricum]NIJ50654.1 thiol-disulfide isomerase/thioredoxin [Rhizomicrobium electricum]